MDVLTFITKTEWPFVIGGCAWFFRKYIASIFKDLHLAKLKVAGAEAEFIRKVEATAALVEIPESRAYVITKQISTKENVSLNSKNTEKKDKILFNEPLASEELSSFEDDTGAFYDNATGEWSSMELSPAQDVFRAYARLEKVIIRGAKDPHDELYLSINPKQIMTIVTYLDLSLKDKIVIANLRKLREAAANGSLSVTPEGAIKYASTVWKIIPHLEEALPKPRVNTEIPKATFEELPEVE